ncbi:hypothetical protein FHETE_10654 [Fusarium heterosporum]|uniref:Uncharacterized protein n=1 Tax=Fusarium heterosporum TaxID=42747 RepID=A0A8H5SQC8_FUSHE|nr:hypothetical protein FHETE_10654 [Fusarium heterosporum]
MATSRAAEKQKESVQPLHIPSNPWATSYKSTWSLPEAGILDAKDLAVLQNLNCSYFSSGRPPTLLAIKQHAHSLVNILRKLVPSSDTSQVGGKTVVHTPGTGSWFREHEAFDWLNNLEKPYENDDPAHHEPLWALHNTVKSESEIDGIEHHCPLTQVEDDRPSARQGDTRRPYMTHHDLIMHANECLEIIDHEYSATGGLMSILPTGFEDPKDTKTQAMSDAQMAGARNSILGQWILHHQHLIGRMHELEINYANAIDAFAGQTIIPLQMKGRSGPDGISGGREIAYPQDKYILVNAGEDIRDYIHRLLDAAEAQIEQKEKIWKASGVSGERMWYEERGGKVYSKGIVPVDLSTRFYRIKGKGNQSPLFVMPAAAQHPGVSQTRLMENRPTVVSVVTPTWPERVSAWEAKHKEPLERAAKLDIDNQTLVRQMAEMRDMMAVKDSEIKRMHQQLAWYEQNGEVIGQEV